MSFESPCSILFLNYWGLLHCLPVGIGSTGTASFPHVLIHIITPPPLHFISIFAIRITLTTEDVPKLKMNSPSRWCSSDTAADNWGCRWRLEPARVPPDCRYQNLRRMKVNMGESVSHHSWFHIWYISLVHSWLCFNHFDTYWTIIQMAFCQAPYPQFNHFQNGLVSQVKQRPYQLVWQVQALSYHFILEFSKMLGVFSSWKNFLEKICAILWHDILSRTSSNHSQVRSSNHSRVRSSNHGRIRSSNHGRIRSSNHGWVKLYWLWHCEFLQRFVVKQRKEE